MTEGAKRPPDAGRTHDAPRVVDDYPITITDAKAPHAPRERGGARQHVRERCARIDDGVDVEEHRARHEGLDKFSARLALQLGHLPGAVDYADVAPAEVLGEPLGGDVGRGLRRA